jgi:sugar phosphate isomerase/epimerase
MRIGFIAENDLPTIELDALFAREHGLAGLEFNHWGSFKDLTTDYIAQMRAILDKYGVRCSTLGLWGWNHTSPDAAERAAAQHELGRLVEFGWILGAETLITSAGRVPGASAAENVEAFAQVFPPYLEAIDAAGMRLSVYAVHGNTFTEAVADFEALWERFPGVGIKFDPANFQHAGLDYLGFLRDHADKVFHVHIKEHLYHEGKLVSQPAAGMGDIAWGKVMAFLHEADYRGYLTIEPHGPLWSRGDLRRRNILLSQRYISQFLV